MIKWIFVFMFHVDRVLNECLAGCRICDSTNNCAFCDFQLNYALTVSNCKAINPTNCTRIDPVGTCLSCTSNNYLDPITSTCVYYDSTLHIPNCLLPSSSTQCAQCAPNYYVLNGNCVAVPTVISNCSIANSLSPDQCQTCASGFVKDQNKQLCLPISKVSNCLGYSPFKCSSCSSGYLLDMNMNIPNSSSATSPIQRFYIEEQLFNDIAGNYDQGTYSTCNKITTPNCLSYLNVNTCQVCLSGYYLDPFMQCQPFPLPSIPNCSVYSNSTICTSCNNGFYLVSSTNCTSAPVSTTCQKYNSSSSTAVCVLCFPSYFLNLDSTCQLRSVSQNILNCLSLNPIADNCLACNTGYVVTNDLLLCLSVIPFCSTYSTSTVSTVQLSCTSCISAYYLSAQTCIKIQIQYCVAAAIVNALVVCTQCQNGYYVSAGLCLSHPSIDNCINYSQSVFNTCSQCAANYFLFTPTNICLPYTYLPSCDVYSSTIACLVCKDGFFVLNGNCAPIVSPTNCLKVSNGLCIKCMSGYYITSSGSCLLPENYFASNCAKSNLDGYANYMNMTCTLCSPNTVPFNYANSYVCMSSSNFPSSATVANCNRYTQTSNVYACALCNSPYFLDPLSNSCVSSCVGVMKPVTLFNYLANSSDLSYSFFSLETTNSCFSDAAYPGCATIYPDLFTHNQLNGEGIYRCGQCKSSYYPVVMTNSIISFGDLVQNNLGVTCVAQANLIGFSGSSSSSVVAGCSLYYKFNLNYYGCYVCAFGFSGPIVVPNISNPSGGVTGVLASCSTPITNCNGNTVLKIFLNNKSELSAYSTHLGSLYSCHVCSAANSIPYIAIDFQVPSTIPVLTTFTIPASGNSLFTSGYSNTVQQTNCYANQASSFGMNSANYVTVPNCGLGVINVWSNQNSLTSISSNPTANTTATFCYACAPGYSSTRVSLTSIVAPLMVYQCNLISNCQPGSTWFNACSSCQTGYVYKYDSVKQNVRFDTCVNFPDANCLSANIDSATLICVICNAGFNLNRDGVCELIQAVNCADTNYNLFRFFNVTFTYDQHSVGIYLLSSSLGCLNCASGYVSIKTFTNSNFCTISNYISKSLYTANATSIFTSKCVNYMFDSLKNNVVCLACVSRYIQNLQGGCISQLSNCLVASSANVCSQCATGFVNAAGTCQTQNIPNCKVFGFSTTQICLTCNSGYYLSGLNCVAGSISNCLNYQSSTICSACSPSFYLISTSNGGSYCFPIPTSQHCSYASSSFLNGAFTCSQCIEGYAISTTVSLIAPSVCYPIVFISNCAVYNLGSTISTSLFSCASCTSAYYLNSTTCAKRAIIFPQCATYTVSNDTCSACVPGYFLSDDKLQCVKYPSGIVGCVAYSSPKNCTQCDLSSYFNGTSCVAATAIPNCAYYKDLTTCSVCAPNYALVSAACSPSSALNCLTWQSTTACGSCPPMSGFQTVSGLKNCVAISDLQCIIYSPLFPFSCSLCNTGYYPLNGVCTSVTSTIEGCISYDGPSTCLQCDSKSVLNVAKNACLKTASYLSYFDAYCSSMSILAQPACNKCNATYYFANGTCTLCSNSTLNIGCYHCDPFNPNKCLVCKSGFFNTINGDCVNATYVPPVINATTNITTPNVTVFNTTSFQVILLTFFAYWFTILL